MPRLPLPEDLLTLRVPVDLQLSPDGRWVAFALKEAGPRLDEYRTSIWLVPSDGSTPVRRLTLGAKNDTSPRWSPDGRCLAFLSDRAAWLQAGGAADRAVRAELPSEGRVQVWLLPVDGGEARQVSRLPRDVTELAWSPDGRRLAVVSAVATARDDAPPDPSRPPPSDIRLIDRLAYQLNGVGFVYDRPGQLWLLDVESGEASLLTRGRTNVRTPAWSPDGRTIAFAADRRPDADLYWRSDVHLLDVARRRLTRVTGGRGEQLFGAPAWSPDGRWLAVLGHRYPAAGGSRADVWRFRPGVDQAGEDLTAESDLMAGSTMNSDLFGGGDARLAWTPDGQRILFAAPVEGSYELFTVEVGTRRIARLTEDRHYLSRADLARLAGGRPGSARVAAVRATGSTPPDIVSLDLPAPSSRVGRQPELRRLTDLMGEAWRGIRLVEPVSRWHEVDGRRIQGWYIAPQGARRGRKAPLVVEIHGGPATLYGWSMFWEWQCLAALGIGVYACNPRGSQGYGQDFQAANIGDWGEGPMRDVMGGVDALIADGLVDADRMGVTGGSYGGYLTSWIVGQTDRFRAAVTCRSVNDMISQMLSGDIGGATFGRLEYRVQPWEDPLLYLEHSPLRYADRITTPLLIQHSEKDLRTPIGQAEELFSVLRSLRREVRLMRVPEETHELTRSGTPFRRVENLAIILDWFRHYLVEGRRGLPPLPRRVGARARRPRPAAAQRSAVARSRSSQPRSSSRPRGSR